MTVCPTGKLLSIKAGSQSPRQTRSESQRSDTSRTSILAPHVGNWKVLPEPLRRGSSSTRSSVSVLFGCRKPREEGCRSKSEWGLLKTGRGSLTTTEVCHRGWGLTIPLSPRRRSLLGVEDCQYTSQQPATKVGNRFLRQSSVRGEEMWGSQPPPVDRARIRKGP